MIFQYQARCEPLLPMAVAALPLWAPILPAEPPARRAPVPQIEQYVCPYVPPEVTVDQWLYPPQHVTPARRIVLEGGFAGPPGGYPPPDVTVDQWLYPPQVPPPARAPAREGSYTLALQALVTPSVDQWGYQAPLFPFTRPVVPGHVPGAQNVEPIPTPAPSFDWFCVQPDMVRRAAPGVFWGQMFSGPATVIVLTTGTEPVLLSRRVSGFTGYRLLD